MKKNKKHLFLVLCSFTAVIMACVCFEASRNIFDKKAMSEISYTPSLVLDAGHGGMDSGAVSSSGVKEKDLNLAITLKTRSLMKLFGIDTVLTRDSDISLGYVEGASVRTNKQSDLYERAKVAEAYKECDFISIHMNKFEQSQYYGAQVFYGNHPRSQILAEEMQKCFRLALDKENDRKTKKSPDTVYIMKKITAPAVIAECGFLSNPRETELLSQNDYQTRVSAAITASYLNFIASE